MDNIDFSDSFSGGYSSGIFLLDDSNHASSDFQSDINYDATVLYEDPLTESYNPGTTNSAAIAIRLAREADERLDEGERYRRDSGNDPLSWSYSLQYVSIISDTDEDDNDDLYRCAEDDDVRVSAALAERLENLGPGETEETARLRFGRYLEESTLLAEEFGYDGWINTWGWRVPSSAEATRLMDWQLRVYNLTYRSLLNEIGDHSC